MNEGQRASATAGDQRSLEQLKRRYRAIGAPPDLALRVAARLPTDPAPHSWKWQPVMAAAVMVVVLVALGFQLSDRGSPAPAGIPSLARLSGGLPKKPGAPVPSLAQVKGVKTPAPPKRPSGLPAGSPRSDLRDEFHKLNWLKENTHG